MRALTSLSLRTRFLLVMLLGALVPLGVVGLWLTRSAQRSGENLVRARLEESLSEVVEVTGRQWTLSQSVVLDLGDSRAVQTALREGLTIPRATDRGALLELAETWNSVARYASSVEIYDIDDEFAGRLPDDLHPGDRNPTTQQMGMLLHRVTIRDRRSGEWLGTLVVELLPERLLPGGVLSAGVGGSVLAVFDARTGNPLVPLSIDPTMFAAERFTWMGEEWLAVERQVGEPPLRFVMAGPVGPVIRPFEEAARRGAFALLFVILAVFMLATLFARHLTRYLEHLSKAARDVSSGDLSRRAEERGPPEVRDTARAFNSMTENLQRLLQRLSQQEAVAAVGEFAASLAHEVRNPLSSISLDLQRTRRKMETDPKEAHVLVDRALGEVERLNQSVTEFLRIARSGRATLECVDLRIPVEAAIRAAEPHFMAKDSSFDYSAPGTPVWVRGDEGALEQLILNLLLNAAEALRPSGRASLWVEVARNEARVSVRDEGEGLAPQDLERIFEPFYSTKDEGTGLGLTIARRIARAHGGELKVESTPGGGTTFRFALSVDERQPTPIVTPVSEAGNGP
jgi:signal transduction histidine kinase